MGTPRERFVNDSESDLFRYEDRSRFYRALLYHLYVCPAYMISFIYMMHAAHDQVFKIVSYKTTPFVKCRNSLDTCMHDLIHESSEGCVLVVHRFSIYDHKTKDAWM